MDSENAKHLQRTKELNEQADSAINAQGSKGLAKKRKAPANDGEKAALEFHQKIKHILATALEQLLALGRRSDAFLLNTPVDVIKSNNNKIAWRAALIQGPGSSLVDETKDLSIVSQPPLLLTDGMSMDQPPVNRMVECSSDHVLSCSIAGARYVIPPRCSFLMSDISRMQPLLKDGKSYNVIVMDPPWENKSVKRKQKYRSLRNEDLFELPVRDLMDQDQCLVAVWVTNKQQQHKFVTEELFPFWDVKYCTTWLWLKITQHGETILPLDGTANGKKPYECLIIGVGGNKCDEIDVPQDKVIVSVPSSVHSWKPPLHEILTPLSPKTSPQCLELFARSLLPGWTSWGNEVLLHQHIDFFHDTIATTEDKIT